VQLSVAAGIAGARPRTREDRARFASIDELIRIEIRGSPLAGPVYNASDRKALRTAPKGGRRFCHAPGRISVRLDAIFTAGKR
jgi:hypothetical protein